MTFSPRWLRRWQERGRPFTIVAGEGARQERPQSTSGGGLGEVEPATNDAGSPAMAPLFSATCARCGRHEVTHADDYFWSRWWAMAGPGVDLAFCSQAHLVTWVRETYGTGAA